MCVSGRSNRVDVDTDVSVSGNSNRVDVVCQVEATGWMLTVLCLSGAGGSASPESSTAGWDSAFSLHL